MSNDISAALAFDRTNLEKQLGLELPVGSGQDALAQFLSGGGSSFVFESLGQAYEAASVCRRCSLCETRTNVVFFDGNPLAKLMIIGEGPGQREDETGLPFVGKAGQLLDRILASVNIDRKKDAY